MTTTTPLPAQTALETLPDDPFCAPPSDLIRYILDRRDHFEQPAIEMLAQSIFGQHVPTKGYRAVYLISLLGEWRSEAAAPVLITHLSTAWGYGWDEIPHAAARIGQAAIWPMLHVAAERMWSLLPRRRAIRSLAAIAFDAAKGADPLLEVERREQWNMVTSALYLILRRGDRERNDVIDEAAARLCDLNHTRSWDEIAGMFRSGILKERDGFNLEVADNLMHGRLAPFSFGTRNQSMVDWMLRKP